MTRAPFLLTLAAAAALAGCNKEDHTIVAGGEPADEPTNAAANAGVQLPPSIVSSKIYRCGDNKLIYVDWMSDGSAHVKKSRGEVGVAIAPNAPELKGNAQAPSITYNGQGCKA